MEPEQIAEYNRISKRRGATGELIFAGPDAPPQGPAIGEVSVALTYPFIDDLLHSSGKMPDDTPEKRVKRVFDFACTQALRKINSEYWLNASELPADVMVFESEGVSLLEFQFKFSIAP